MIENHLSRLEMISENEKGIERAEKFLDVQLFLLSIQTPWYVDIVNFFAYGVVPPEFSNKQRRKLRTYCRFYIWDDPLLYKRGAYMIIRRCVPEI